MLKELKFVQGAVANKDYQPAMTHFRIEGGFVRSYNGVLALCSPLPVDINCAPRAVPLVKAIDACEEVITLSMTDAGRLRVQSGKFRAFIECVDGEVFQPMPSGEMLPVDGAVMLEAFRLLDNFIGNDASRPFCNGILFNGQSAFATNNVCLVEYWVGTDVPNVNIPQAAIKEVLRIKEPPTGIQVDQKCNSVTFHYTDGRWIRTQLLTTGWPDLRAILDKPSNAQPIDPRIFDGIAALEKLTDDHGRMYVKNGKLHTHLEEQTGGSYDLEGVEWEGCYQVAMIGKLKGVVTHIDFTTYPGPCMFFGERMRGAIIGMKM